MSPRPGGEADKFGNRYEGAWIVRQALDIIAGRADRIQVEPPGPDGQGVECLLWRGKRIEAHQVKRQAAGVKSWTLQRLISRGVIDAARAHVSAGRQFHFVSTIPTELDDLADRARRSDNLRAFVEDAQGSTLWQVFTELTFACDGAESAAFQLLQAMVLNTIGEDVLGRDNDTLAELLLDGGTPRARWVLLGDLINNSLALNLTAELLEARFENYGLQRAGLLASASLMLSASQLTEAWKTGVDRLQLEPCIGREEAQAIFDGLVGDGKLTFAVGAAGGGKTGVLRQVVERAEVEGWPVLAFRLDRLAPFTTQAELARQLELAVSPLIALAGAAGGSPALLVVDQLDAVSLASGRLPDSFPVIADLLARATAVPHVRILVACRKFDVDNDYRIRSLVRSESGATTVTIGRLTAEQVDAALEAMALEPTRFSAGQRDLLRSPLALQLLSQLLNRPALLSFTTIKDLYDFFYEEKRRSCQLRWQGPPELRFSDVLHTLAEAMSRRQVLSLPRSVLDVSNLGADADVLTSEHVLNEENGRLSFFHESLFDYVFARQWLNRQEDLLTFLVGAEQDLFRRAQVRQILMHLRQDDPSRYIAELANVLFSPDVRFHIKDVVLGLLRAVDDPMPGEWRLIERCLTEMPDLSDRIWLMVRTLPWFDFLDRQGLLASWLRGEAEQQARAVETMASVAADRPARVAALLTPYIKAPNYAAWLAHVIRVHDFNEGRELFDLALNAVREGVLAGDDSLWIGVHDLAGREPLWAIELLEAFLVQRPGALELTDDGYVEVLRSSEYWLLELVRESATAEPGAFARALLPYMLGVMQLVEYDRVLEGPVLDKHFWHRVVNAVRSDLDDVLLYGMRDALVAIVVKKSEGVEPLLQDLAADPHDSAQWLLYEALSADGERFVDWAVDLLLESRSRLLAGYSDGTTWTTRQLVVAIGSHLSDVQFNKLEQAFIDLRYPWERRGRYFAAFSLLSALPSERLTADGRRRLGELQRRMGALAPDAPVGMTGGWVGSPIPAEASRRMTDEQWMRAIRKYDGEYPDRLDLRGGASELAHQLLKPATQNNPMRFARLALTFTSDVNPVYSEAILMGLGNSTEPFETGLLAQVVHHLAELHDGGSVDRWLGWAFRQRLKDSLPLDVVELLLDRALHSPNPSGEHWRSGIERAGRHDAIYSEGINSARGTCAETLGDLLIHDVEGRYAAIVGPALLQLAGDPSAAVRSCVAHTIATSLIGARDAAMAAFPRLLDTTDHLLGSQPVMDLVAYVARQDKSMAVPVIERMLQSDVSTAARNGGRLAAWLGIQWDEATLLLRAQESTSIPARAGAAEAVARLLPTATDADLATAALEGFMNDEVDEVRNTAAEVAGALRGRPLGPYRAVLRALYQSPAFGASLSQLLITLDFAPDRIDDLIVEAAGSFIAGFGPEAGDIRTRRAADARNIAELIFRAYHQADDPAVTRQLLNLMDGLLRINAYGVGDLLGSFDRQ